MIDIGKHVRLGIIFLAVAAVMVVGCGTPARTGPTPPADDSLAPDPTGSRLQDLAGAMLLFHGAYDRLPESLLELKLTTGLQDGQLIDPVTGKTFIYAPRGVAAAADGRKVVLLGAPRPDAEICLGVSIGDANGGLLADVVRFPAEAYATMQSGQADAGRVDNSDSDNRLPERAR